MGRTGSGKTQAGAWLLSLAPFHTQPYIIIDFKGDDLLNSIDRAKEIGLHEKLPDEPGVYIAHPNPGDADALERFLFRVWRKERTGLLFDEAYMVPDQEAFQAILTQGRSKEIPAIILTQRPVWISRFVFSEADFYAVFHLNDRRDQKSVAEFTPNTPLWDLTSRIPDYHFRWYDVSGDYSTQMQPVPDRDMILETFEKRLSVRKRKAFI